MLIPSFKNDLQEDLNGKSIMEATRLAPIGKKGPRKANPSYKRRTREPWSSADVKMLKQLAKGNTPTGVMSVKLQRPVAAIRSGAPRRYFPEAHQPFALQPART